MKRKKQGLKNKVDTANTNSMMGHILDILSMIPIPGYLLNLETSEFIFGNDQFLNLDEREGTGQQIIDYVFALFQDGEPDNPVNIELRREIRLETIGFLAWKKTQTPHGLCLVGLMEDRTEVLELNRMLDDHRAIIELMLDHVQSGSWYWDLLKERVELHDPMLKLMNWGPEMQQLTFHELMNRIHPEDVQNLSHRLDLMREDKTSEKPFDLRVMESDEVKIVLRCKGLVSRRGEDGTPVGAVGTCIDVTDYRQNFDLIALQRDLAMTMSAGADVNKTLQQCAEIVKKRVSLGFVGVYIQNENPPHHFEMIAKTSGNREILDTIRSVPPSVIPSLNITLDQPCYLPYSELLEKGFIPFIDIKFQAIAIIPFSIGNGLYGGLVAGSQTREDLGGLTKTSLESLSHLMSSLFKKKRIEQQLQQSEEQYRTLYQNMNQGLALLELIYENDEPVDYTLVEANQAFARILDLPPPAEIQNYTGSNLFGRRVIPFLPELDQVLTTNESMQFSRYEPTVGKHLALSAFKYGEGKAALLVHDETQQKKVERQSMHAQKMEALSRLSGGIAHDFNNLLQIIVGYAEMLKKIPGAGPASDHIMEASNSAMKLVRKISMFDSIQDTNYKNVYVDVVIHNTLKMLSWLVEQSIHVELEPAETTRPVWADPSMLEQIFINMCLNSRDAMPSGGIIRIRTDSVSLSEAEGNAMNLSSGEYVRVTFRDTGKGIRDDISDKIFDPFFTTKPFGEASGLGLSTVYTILQKLGGTIQLVKDRSTLAARRATKQLSDEVISANGSGAQFEIYLPISNQSPVAPKPKPRQLSIPDNRACILLAEDEPEVRELLLRRLESAGYSVITASNGPEAVIKFQKHIDEVDLLIFDQIMPGMTGTAAYEMISRQRPDIPVIFSSGYTSERIDPAQFDQEHIAFLTKPYRQKELMHTIQTLLSPPD